ncbi:MAG: hypothetical protein Q8R76_03580 [Candidatus Omnitrophota bacterium]|nr:hypothetical protein [Candidatus Omnitrophota bacterium]
MKLKQAFSFFFVAVLLLAGCSAEWRDKFIRKSESKAPARAQFAIDQVQRPYPDLYRERFNYWKNWHRQLVQDLGGNRKRELQDHQEARRHLSRLEKYVTDEKKEVIRPLVREFDELTQAFLEKQPDSLGYSHLRRKLDALHLRIDRTLQFKEMAGHILPTPVTFDMDEYEGEEPLVTEVKAPVLEVDTFKDEEAREITYEEYRALPIL